MCDLAGREEETEARTGVSGFVDELVVAITNGRIYLHDHPRSQRSIVALCKTLEQLIEEEPTQRVVIGAHDGFLIHKERPLLGASLSAPRIIGPLSELGAGGLSFGSGASAMEFRSLVDLLGRRDLAQLNREQAQQVLASVGVTRIDLLPAYTEQDHSQEQFLQLTGQDSEVNRLRVPVHLYQEIVDLLQDVMVKACRGEQLGVDSARGYVESVLSQLEHDSRGLMSASRYEKYDAFTFGHSIRVCFLALNFARTLTADEELLQRVGLAALLHDVGKAHVPFEILHAQGKLSNEQRAEMNKHTVYGGEILLGVDHIDSMAVTVAYGHHHTMTGGGYPKTVHEARLSLGTRIVKICDVYEALTSVRPYKDRMSPTRAFRAMMGMKDHLDPRVLRRFIKHMGIYPQGSRVRLEGGQRAHVVSQTDSFAQPIVQLECAASGELLHPEDRIEVDLSQPDTDEALAVTELLVETLQ